MGIEPTRAALPGLENKPFGAMTDAIASRARSCVNPARPSSIAWFRRGSDISLTSETIMDHVNKSSLLVATLLFASSTLIQTSRAGDSVGATRVDAIYSDIEKLYIDLHRNPELAFHEQRTAATLTARVKALGYEVTTGVGGTGVVAILKNGPGPVVMLRTELDALPIEEKTGLPFASTVKTKNDAGEVVPVAHMCGHDLHMSAWVGPAELMAKNRERWHGTLMLVGQPAEEIVAGATAMLRDGLFTRFPKPDYALGMHDEPALPAGVIGFHPGHHITGDAAGGVDDGDAHAFIAPARDSHEAPVSDRERRYVHTAADHGAFE